jgi:hypothetical protein
MELNGQHRSFRMPPARLELVLEKPVEHRTDDADDDAAQECRDEAKESPLDHQGLGQPTSQHEHEGIDDQTEQPECDHADRQGQELDDWTDQGID